MWSVVWADIGARGRVGRRRATGSDSGEGAVRGRLRLRGNGRANMVAFCLQRSKPWEEKTGAAVVIHAHLIRFPFSRSPDIGPSLGTRRLLLLFTQRSQRR
jgi:hypothetical protein